MYNHSYDPFNPSPHQAQLYTQFLANSFKSTQAIRNYLSGAKTFLKNNLQNPSILSSFGVHKTLRGIDRISTHIPSQAPELSITEIKHISQVCLALGPTFSGHHAALLIMFASFLRQSNASLSGSDVHMLRTRDLNLQDGTLWVTIRSSKTIIAPTQAVSLPVYPARGRHCPVAAWLYHRHRSPRSLTDHAFLCDDLSPITPASLLKIVKIALADIGSPKTSTVTLHSLRRSASCHAARGGATVDDVRAMGTWHGDSVFTYVPRKLFSQSAKIISQSLAE